MFAKSCEVRLPIGIPCLPAGRPFREPPPRPRVRWIACDNSLQKQTRIGIANAPCKNIEKNGVIHAIEEFSYITLQCKACSRIVAAFGPEHFRDSMHTSVRAFADPARKRTRNERGFEDRVQYPEYRVVQNAIANCGFVDTTSLRIMDPKSFVRPVLVPLVAQIAMQLENMLLKVAFKYCNVRLVVFILFEYFPCSEQIFRRDNLRIDVLIRFHTI